MVRDDFGHRVSFSPGIVQMLEEQTIRAELHGLNF